MRAEVGGRDVLGGGGVRRVAGPDKRETLECVENIGNNLLFLGHLDEAAAMHAYVAERRRLVLGLDHSDTLNTLRRVLRTHLRRTPGTLVRLTRRLRPWTRRWVPWPG